MRVGPCAETGPVGGAVGAGPRPSLATSRRTPGRVSVGAASVRAVPTSPPDASPDPSPAVSPGPVEHLRAFLDAMGADPDRDPLAARWARAVSGESPERLRDRLVLERAAHLVATTERPLADIAAESGFTGYDVFVRAFRREYGDLPSVWRLAPTSWRIDTVTEVHVDPPDGVRLPPRPASEADDLLALVARRHVEVVRGLIDDVGDGTESTVDDDAADAATHDADPDVRRSALVALVAQVEAVAAGRSPAPVPDLTPGLTSGLTSGPVSGQVSCAALRARLEAAADAFVDRVALLGASRHRDETVVSAFTASPTARSPADAVADVLAGADGLRHLAAR